MTELPVAGYSPESPNPPTPPNLTDVANDIADAITAPNSGDPTNVRVGAVTAVEATSPYRVRLDITGTAWISRNADSALKVGDRVWAVQQGEVTIVGGRLNALDAFTPIGTVLPYAGSSSAVPTGWLLCDGTAVSRTTYAALFAVCGTTYGAGNGTTTFNLPSLTNRVPVGSGGSYSRGGTGGAASVTLTDAQMPNHNHSLSVSGSANSAGSHSHSGGTDSGGSHSHSEDGTSTRSDLLAGGGTTAALPSGGSTGSAGSHSHGFSTDSGGSHSHTVSISGSVGSAGSDASHENMPPFVAMPYIIRAN